MLFNRNIINPASVYRASDAIFNPVGFSQDVFLDIFNDVKSFSCNGVSIIDSTLAQQIGASSITESLQALANFDNSNNSAIFSGPTFREIKPLGLLSPTGAVLYPRETPLVNYPVHVLSAGGQGTVSIDFGKTLGAAGIYYPAISVRFGTDMGSLASGPIVGGIRFDRYGIIPIYGGPALSTNLIQGFADGAIVISERYSSLRASSLVVAPQSELVFTATKPLTSLTNYRTAYMGAVEIPVKVSNNSLSFTVPKHAKSGPVRFVATSPHFDSFLSYDEITVSS